MPHWEECEAREAIASYEEHKRLMEEDPRYLVKMLVRGYFYPYPGEFPKKLSGYARNYASLLSGEVPCDSNFFEILYRTKTAMLNQSVSAVIDVEHAKDEGIFADFGNDNVVKIKKSPLKKEIDSGTARVLYNPFAEMFSDWLGFVSLIDDEDPNATIGQYCTEKAKRNMLFWFSEKDREEIILASLSKPLNPISYLEPEKLLSTRRTRKYLGKIIGSKNELSKKNRIVRENLELLRVGQRIKRSTHELSEIYWAVLFKLDEKRKEQQDTVTPLPRSSK